MRVNNINNMMQAEGNFILGSSIVNCDFPGTIGTYYIDVTYDMYSAESGRYTLNPIYERVNVPNFVYINDS